MMVKIELQRSGGFMGRPASANGSFDIDEAALVAKLNDAAREPNPMARDDFYYTMVINGKEYNVDAGKLKGELKKIFTKLEGKLKIVP
jgi:hypothetical protein